MSNKEHLWRLKDDEGKPAAKKPEMEVEAFFNGKSIGKLQPITMEARRSEDIYEIGTTAFLNEYMGSWTDAPLMRSTPIQRRTIEVEYDRIMDMMYEEVSEYQRRFYNRPHYLSLSKKGYESFYVLARQDRGYPSRNLDYDTFVGVDIICNPLQERPVMALGDARQEGIEGRLYREQS
jgi:hypothetical protein